MLQHTWNIFFSEPLCLVYSFGRNSFRLHREPDTVAAMSCRHFLFGQHSARYEVIPAPLPTYRKTVVTADITAELSTRRKSLKQQPDSRALWHS